MKTETTLRVEAVKPVFKGFRVIVGHKKGSGMFEYVVGNKKEAQKIGEGMKVLCKNMVYKQHKRIFIHLEPVKLKKCDISYCNNLCESEDRYCLSCDDAMLDAQMEQAKLNEVYKYG